MEGYRHCGRKLITSGVGDARVQNGQEERRAPSKQASTEGFYWMTRALHRRASACLRLRGPVQNYLTLVNIDTSH